MSHYLWIYCTPDLIQRSTILFSSLWEYDDTLECLSYAQVTISLTSSFFKQKLHFNFCLIKCNTLLLDPLEIFSYLRVHALSWQTHHYSQTVFHILWNTSRETWVLIVLGSQVKWHSSASSPSEIMQPQITWFLSNILHQNQDELAALFLRKAKKLSNFYFRLAIKATKLCKGRGIKELNAEKKNHKQYA